MHQSCTVRWYFLPFLLYLISLLRKLNFVKLCAYVTFGGNGGIMTTARPELPYPCSPQAKTLYKSSLRRSNVTG